MNNLQHYNIVRELTTQCQPIFEESKGSDKKRCYIEGIFLQADIKNRNGRIYPGHVMEEAVNKMLASSSFKKDGGIWGEMDHPSPSRPGVSNERICIKTVSLTREGSNWIGKALVTNTNLGKQLEGLIGDGMQPGVSSRAMAATKMENGTTIIQPGMHFCTPADVVSDPSAPDAFTQGVMENHEWIYEDGLFVEADLLQAKKYVRQQKSKDLQSAYQNVFNHFFKF